MKNPICVYTAPLKALSSEKFDEWSKGVFRDKNIVMLTGDTLTSQKIRQQKMRECENAHIVLCTSELLDSLTRNHGSEHYSWIYRVGLVIVDECHIIASQGRGDCVESAIMRFTSINPAAKVWLLSATAPNADQFSTWLTHLNGKPTHVLNSSWRPTTLVWHYLQHEIFGSYQENQMSKMVNTLQIMQSKPDEKYLVFVWDKNTGRMLSKLLQDENINNSFYNADLEYGDRRDILQRFETPELNALISTPALAWGSLHEDSLVRTVFGVYRYGSLKPGMKILSFNETLYCYEFNEVLNVELCNEEYEYVIELEDGIELIAGPSHPIYVIENDELINKRADHLMVGDDIKYFS